MTNPVNAGADIEKELAEKLDWRIEGSAVVWKDPRGKWWRSCAADNAHITIYAALLAKAGERAKLEVELNSQRERVLAILNLLTGFEAEFLGRYRYHDTCLSCAVKVRKAIDRLIVEVESWPAELRASTEAERADREEDARRDLAATAYQVCGALNAPARILDYFSATADATGEPPPSPLPITGEEIAESQRAEAERAAAMEQHWRVAQEAARAADRRNAELAEPARGLEAQLGALASKEPK